MWLLLLIRVVWLLFFILIVWVIFCGDYLVCVGSNVVGLILFWLCGMLCVSRNCVSGLWCVMWICGIFVCGMFSELILVGNVCYFLVIVWVLDLLLVGLWFGLFLLVCVVGVGLILVVELVCLFDLVVCCWLFLVLWLWWFFFVG